MYELTGTVKRIGETMMFANNFTKRELVVTENGNSEWPNVLGFAFKRGNCEQLDKLSVGDEVKIGFVVDGREWTDPKTNKTKCFNDLTAIRLEVLRAANTSASNAPTAAASASSGDDDSEMPF